MHVWFLSSGSTPSGFDLLNLFAAAASIVLAIVALALSIFFFVQSKKAADQSSKSAAEITSSVERLQALFNSLYSDTFSIMRDTVTDMRQHIWNNLVKSGEDTAESDAIRIERENSQAALLKELDRVSRQIGIQDGKISQLRDELAPVVDRTLKEQEEIIATINTERLRSAILATLRQSPKSAALLQHELDVTDLKALMSTLFDLEREGLVTWRGPRDSLGWGQVISCTEDAQ